MSKYTEAERFFKEHDHDGCLENCFENSDMSCDNCDKQRQTILEALQIADRLEQAENIDAVGYATSWFKLGYETALADIRGDNNV